MVKIPVEVNNHRKQYLKPGAHLIAADLRWIVVYRGVANPMSIFYDQGIANNKVCILHPGLKSIGGR